MHTDSTRKHLNSKYFSTIASYRQIRIFRQKCVRMLNKCYILDLYIREVNDKC